MDLKSMVLLSRLVSIAASIATLCTLCACTGMFFYPETSLILTPADVKLPYQDLRLTNTDGTNLQAWYLAALGQAHGTVLYLHGNAQNMSYHLPAVAWLPAEGYNVMLLDYRGYGNSSGTPSIAGAISDIETALEYLSKRTRVDHTPLIVLGQSLGGALAIRAVACSKYRQQIHALVVDSAFSDYRQITREKLNSSWLLYPFSWPLSLLIDNTNRPLDFVAQISPIPLLLIHGDQDSVVSLNHSAALLSAAKEPKQLWLAAGTGHTQALAQPLWRAKLLRYLQDKLSPAL